MRLCKYKLSQCIIFELRHYEKCVEPPRLIYVEDVFRHLAYVDKLKTGFGTSSKGMRSNPGSKLRHQFMIFSHEGSEPQKEDPLGMSQGQVGSWPDPCAGQVGHGATLLPRSALPQTHSLIYVFILIYLYYIHIITLLGSTFSPSPRISKSVILVRPSPGLLILTKTLLCLL